MPRIDIDRNYGQVASTIENHYVLAKVGPPEGHPNGRSCPQCGVETWRLTQWCIHCGADLFAIDRQIHQRRVAMRGLAIGGFFMALSAMLFFAQRFLPDEARLWMLGAGVISMIIAGAAVKN